MGGVGVKVGTSTVLSTGVEVGGGVGVPAWMGVWRCGVGGRREVSTGAVAPVGVGQYSTAIEATPVIALRPNATAATG